MHLQHPWELPRLIVQGEDEVEALSTLVQYFTIEYELEQRNIGVMDNTLLVRYPSREVRSHKIGSPLAVARL